MRKTCLAIAVVISILSAFGTAARATTYYVDGSVSSSGNGQSWATAWKSFSNVTGLKPGDIVYVSGGSTSQAYSLSDWTPPSGTSGNPITFETGQDAGHSGVVTITSSDSWLYSNFSYVTINGNVGGAQHWSVTPSNYLWEGGVGSGTATGVTLEYITVPNMGAGFHWSAVNISNFTLEHSNIVKTNDSSNMHDFIFFGAGGNGNNIHDNYIQFPYSSSDHSIGDDMWIWPNGVNFYNNTVKGSPISYSWNQHSDVFQASLESNIHIYDNEIIDPGESVYYEDSQAAGTVSSVLIYNNLIVRSYACNGGAQRIFDMNPESGGANTTAYSNVVIANNTIVDQMGACIFTARFLAVGSFSNTYFVNNIQYPQDNGLSIQNGVTVSNNYAGNGITFASYVQYGGASNNLDLTSGDSAAIGRATSSMSGYFTTDYDGGSRGSSWDIGAYQFGSTAALLPPTGLTAAVQ